MKITGILAEYNPFHNGHLHQIQKIRTQTDSDYIIILMSGNFVQRGEPAIIDKYARAKMALSCGADLVLELPAMWASASAEYFAKAGVFLFEQMGCIDTLCFGTETFNIPLLKQTASFLYEEPNEYQALLSSFLKNGLPYPAARMKAMLEYCRTNDLITDEKELSALLSSPNNILALEYMKALKMYNSSITPFPILREGAGYHDQSLETKNASATAIRRSLKDNTAPDALTDAIPPAANAVFSDYLSRFPYMEANDFSEILHYLLLLYSAEELAHFADCNLKIAHRLKNNLGSFSSFTQFCEQMKSRDITYTRMSRIFTHILLHLTNEDYVSAKENQAAAYLRPLGFCKKSAPLLSVLKKNSSIPFLSKTADAKKVLSESAWNVFEKDIFAADLYEQILSRKKGIFPRSEYSRQIIVF